MGLATTTIPIPGMVTLYEEHLVRSKRGYTIPQWRALDPMERATEVALGRIEDMVEYIKNSKEKELMERQSRRKK